MKKDPFPRNAKVGFHVVQAELSGLLCLECFVHDGSKATPDHNPMSTRVTVRGVEKPTMTQRGEIQRLRLLLDSLSRYLNTGGTWDEISEVFSTVRSVWTGSLSFPGWHLLESYYTDQGVYQHVFVSDRDRGEKTRAILWEEPDYNETGGLVGGFINRTTLGGLRRMQENDEGPKHEEAQEDDSAADAGASTALQLPFE